MYFCDSLSPFMVCRHLSEDQDWQTQNNFKNSWGIIGKEKIVSVTHLLHSFKIMLLTECAVNFTMLSMECVLDFFINCILFFIASYCLG